MDISFKPSTLPTCANLEEYNKWERDFLAHLDVNKSFFATSMGQMKRSFVTSLVDSRIQSAMETNEEMMADIPIFSANDDKW